MSEFAEYSPLRPAGARPDRDLRIRYAEPGDLPDIAKLTAEREGGRPEKHAAALENQPLGSPIRGQLFVADARSHVVGFARTGWLEIESIPKGWYLAGLIVSASHRRSGVGRALTARRLHWLSSRTDRVYYFANARNRASIDLHSEFGFVEVERGIQVPGVTFEGGIGVLYGLELESYTIHRSDHGR